jgi:hypothetical protein
MCSPPTSLRFSRGSKLVPSIKPARPRSDGQTRPSGDKSHPKSALICPGQASLIMWRRWELLQDWGVRHVDAGNWCSGNRLVFDAKCTCRRSSSGRPEPSFLHGRSLLRGEVFGLSRRDVGPGPRRDRRGDRGSTALPRGHACPNRAGCPLDRTLTATSRSADDLGLAFVTPRYEQ